MISNLTVIFYIAGPIAKIFLRRKMCGILIPNPGCNGRNRHFSFQQALPGNIYSFFQQITKPRTDRESLF